MILVAAHAPKKALQETTSQPASHSGNTDALQKQASGQPQRVGDALFATASESDIEQALIERGIIDKQAQRLVSGRGVETLERIKAIIAHFDMLVSTQSHLVSRNPAGFLFRAAQKPFDFVLPIDKSRGPSSAPKTQGDLTFDRRASDSAKASAKRRDEKLDAEVSYLIERKSALDALREVVPEPEREQLRAEVELALAKLRAHISPQRFQEAVEHGVEQRLLEKRGFPDFDKWVKNH